MYKADSGKGLRETRTEYYIPTHIAWRIQQILAMTSHILKQCFICH